MPAPEGQTILLVEDNQSIQALFAAQLRLEGFTVLTARHVDETLQICKEYPEPINLLVADVLLPKTGELQVLGFAKSKPSQANGVDLAQKVRFKRPEARVLFISGHSDPELDRMGVFKPPWPLLRKPFNPDTLVAAVQQVLQTNYPPWVY